MATKQQLRIDVFKRVRRFWLAGFVLICLLLVLIDRWNEKPLENFTQSIFRVECFSTNTTDVEDVDEFIEIQQMIDLVKNKTRDDMIGYPYPDGVTKFEDLIIAEKGRPIRSVILSTWRSGSTFFVDILAAQPANFYLAEPLSHFDEVRIRGPPLASEALKFIQALLSCEFAGQDEYINLTRMRPWLLKGTKYFQEQCERDNNTCYDHRYLSGICKVHPFQTVKLTRLRLSIAQELLADEKLGVRMVLLIRDPRGTMQSRKSCPWCTVSPDCSEPALHCADLVSDYKMALKLTKKYPGTFRVIRYEDLSTDPFGQTKELLEFYGRDLHPNVINYLETHTSAQFDHAYGTYRDSKSTPFHWKTDLTFAEVDEIQRTCAAAMKHWGYVPAVNATHLTEFNPVTDYNMMNL